jgi:hypothetical protein
VILAPWSAVAVARGLLYSFGLGRWVLSGMGMKTQSGAGMEAQNRAEMETGEKI